jgi:hypothetical protein
MLRNTAVAIALVLASTAAAHAREWAQKMFSATTHDFGHVARGAKAEFAFELQNLYEEDVHIADVRTSCGCTTPTITRPTLKTWEKGAIVATLNTRSFVGQRNSTLTVVIDRPYYAEVHLTISGYIYSDVDFQPGVAALGDVAQGSAAEQVVMVTYRGYANWQIADVRSANTHLEVELGDPIRQPGVISYRMLVRLKPDAPAGVIQDQLTLITNDQRMPAVVLPVEGRVVPPLAVSPSPLLIGNLAAGQSIVKQLVVTGKQPFKILSIAADCEAVQVAAPGDVTKKVHVIPVKIVAPEKAGEFRATISIETDMANVSKVTCLARGTVRGDTPTAAVPGGRTADATQAR